MYYLESRFHVGNGEEEAGGITYVPIPDSSSKQDAVQWVIQHLHPELKKAILKHQEWLGNPMYIVDYIGDKVKKREECQPICCSGWHPVRFSQNVPDVVKVEW